MKWQTIKNCKFIKILSKRSVSDKTDEAEEDFFDDKPIDIDHVLMISGYGVNNFVLSKGVIKVDVNGNIIKPGLIITSDLLKDKEELSREFDIHYPDGLRVSENAILEMQEKNIETTEVAEALFADKAFDKYRQLINPVKILYDEKTETAEQAYNRASEPADKIFDEAIDRLDDECDQAIEAAEKEYRKITDGLKDVANRKIRRAMLSSAGKEQDAAIEKVAKIYDDATNILEEDYNKALGPAGQARREQTVGIMQLYDRTKAIAFIKSCAFK